MTYRPTMLRNLAEITIPVLFFCNGHVLFAGIAKSCHENPLAKYDSIPPGSDRICVAHPALQEDHKDHMFFSHHLLKEKQANDDKKETNSLCVQCTIILQTTAPVKNAGV